METVKVSKRLLNRLPVYLNYLKSLPEDHENVSATVMARELNLGDVQVRKDLAKVSAAGRRRTGRSRQQLILDIESYLDVTTDTGTVLVGAGKLGQALLDYQGFDEFGLNILAAFDANPEKEGVDESGKPILPLEKLHSFCRSNKVLMGIITVPSSHAQEVCDLLIANGVKAIWNFAPAHLEVPGNILVQTENMATSLAVLSMHLQAQMKPKKD